MTNRDADEEMSVPIYVVEGLESGDTAPWGVVAETMTEHDAALIVEGINALPGILDELDALRAALEAMVKKWTPHSGSCCTFDESGGVVVTNESCVCGPLAKQAHAALAALDAAP
jgi:hypothetical protein